MVHRFGMLSLRSKELTSKINKKNPPTFVALPLKLMWPIHFRAEERFSLKLSEF